jgi:hypothetical protein
MAVTTEYNARTDSHPEWYDLFPEPTTFPNGSSLVDMLDTVHERPRDNLPVAVNQTTPKLGSELALS